MFLTLLTEQMQNQDPLNPLDSNEFVSQLVQFSSVEQQINQNRNLESLLTLHNRRPPSRLRFPISAARRRLRPISPNSRTAKRNGAMCFRAKRPMSLWSFRDSRGAIVDRAEGATNAGEQSFTWDGMGLSGGASPDGLYTLEVYATDANGDPIAASTRASGRVTASICPGRKSSFRWAGCPYRSQPSVRCAR